LTLIKSTGAKEMGLASRIALRESEAQKPEIEKWVAATQQEQWVVENLSRRSALDISTPTTLVNEMLDKLWPYLTITLNTKFLDPACGRGTFLRLILSRLMKERILVKKFPSLPKREEYIKNNMLYGFEIDAAFVRVLQMQGYRNVVLQDALEYITDMKFDVVIGNPPYQKPAVKKGTTGNGGAILWPEFVNKAFSLIKPAGIISFIHPPIWRKPGHKLFKVIAAKDISYLRIFSLAEGQKLFGVSSAVDWYVIQNQPNTGKTIIQTTDSTFEEDLTSCDFIASVSSSNPISKAFSKKPTQEILFSETDFFTRKGSRERLTRAAIPGFYSIKEDILQEIYFPPTPENKAKAKRFLVPKVIVQLTGHRLHTYNDAEGKYVLPQFCCAIPIHSAAEGTQIVNWFQEHEEALEDLKWGMTRPWRLYTYLKPGFYEVPVD
jgi:hypothetical protein